MNKFILITFFIFWIVLVIYLLYESFEFYFKTPNTILKKFGEPQYTFWTNILYSIFKNNLCFSSGNKGASISPVFISIYQNFIVVKCSKFEIKIDKKDIIEFNKPTLFKNCSLKIKTHDVYKSETLEFVFITKKQVKLIQEFIDFNE